MRRAPPVQALAARVGVELPSPIPQRPCQGLGVGRRAVGLGVVGVQQSRLDELVGLLPRRVQQLQVLDLLEAQTDGRLAPLSEASCPCDSVRRPYSWSVRLLDGDAAGAGRARHRGVLVCASTAPGAAFWAASNARNGCFASMSYLVRGLDGVPTRSGQAWSPQREPATKGSPLPLMRTCRR